MTGPSPSPARPSGGGAVDTVFFLSDYGLDDEFVGVVGAVLRRLAPHATVVELGHGVPAFDVRAGAAMLARAVPHLGPGVVLAVVDPGVGGGRRALVVEVAGQPDDRPRWFVGPDNGLLLPAVQAVGGVGRAVSLPSATEPGAVTFDGRDVFAPAAAALSRGVEVSSLGEAVDPAGLSAVPPWVCEAGALDDGRRVMRAEVTWVDRFGNCQLAAGPDDVPANLPRLGVAVAREPDPPLAGGRPAPVGLVAVPRVRTFADLGAGEAGVVVDANGRLALVVGEGSASLQFGVVAGDLVELVW